MKGGENLMTKEIPVGVKVISILYYVTAALAVLGAILLFVGSAFISSLFQNIPILSIIGAVGSGLFIFIGIVALIYGALDFFIGRGLWNTKSWARILVIIFSCIGVLMGLVSIASGFFAIVQLAISGVIGGYLIFSKEVKKAFK